MNAGPSTTAVEAHGEAAEQFAQALRKSFPSVAAQINEQTAISFQGTLKGKDLFCTIQKLEEPTAKPKYSRHYDPNDPVVVERRKRLFASLNANHTPESTRALRELSDE